MKAVKNLFKCLNFQLYAPAIILVVWAVLIATTGVGFTPVFLVVTGVAVVIQVRALIQKYNGYKENRWQINHRSRG